MYVEGFKSTGAGGAAVAVLPNTGVFRPFFVLGATLLAMGVIMLTVAGVATVRQMVTRGE
jgi:hypothetical protein